MKYRVSLAEPVIDEAGKKMPYLRVTFKPANVSKLVALDSRPVILTFFDNSGKRIKDAKGNIDAVAYKASVDNIKALAADPALMTEDYEIESFAIEVEPYCRIVDGKVERDADNKIVLRDKLLVSDICILNELTGEVTPQRGWEVLKRVATGRVNNSASYITKARLVAMQQSQQQQVTPQPQPQPTLAGMQVGGDGSGDNGIDDILG